MLWFYGYIAFAAQVSFFFFILIYSDNNKNNLLLYPKEPATHPLRSAERRRRSAHGVQLWPEETGQVCGADILSSSQHSSRPNCRGLVYRHLFLFDVAAVVCKRRGDNYEMKDVLDLNVFKITDNPMSDKEGKKVISLSVYHTIFDDLRHILKSRKMIFFLKNHAMPCYSFTSESQSQLTFKHPM